jgi:TolB protein
MKADGSRKRRITHNPATDIDPVFSPDGREIAFTSKRRGGYDIYVMRANGTHIRRLTRDRRVPEGRRSNYDGQPAFSPNGKRIVFVSDRKGYPNIYLMNADGSRQHRLTRGLGFPGSPSFSPDSHRITFASSPRLLSQIFTMRTDGSHKRQLTRGPGFTYDPAFSPTAPRIAFARDDERAAGNIWVMRADGSNQHAVTANPQNETLPAFSPGGEAIAFVKGSDIYTINVDGSEQDRLTSTSAVDSQPTWGK